MWFPLAFLALVLERVFGYPNALYRVIGHPVTWIGKLITLMDRGLNRSENPTGTRRLGGVLCVLVLVLLGLPFVLIETELFETALLTLGFAVLATMLIAQRSLDDHVTAVADALDREGLEGGRAAVSMIVGRDPDRLDEAGVCRAAIESLAENFSDGIVAPAFWLGVGGLGGGVAYKAVNTADSMIGHRTPKHEAFGWAAARLDDLVNLPASRLSALLFIASAAITKGADARAAWRAVRRDARKHRSPNAGWPEAAMAGALGLSLAGPRIYAGKIVADAAMGDGRSEATVADLRRALELYRTADLILMILFGLLALLAVTIA